MRAGMSSSDADIARQRWTPLGEGVRLKPQNLQPRTHGKGLLNPFSICRNGSVVRALVHTTPVWQARGLFGKSR
jgi:hypothetical protein